MLLDEYQGLPLIEWFNFKVLEEEYRQIELYVRNHIKKETKVGSTIFLGVFCLLEHYLEFGVLLLTERIMWLKIPDKFLI